jgi:TRAP-type C4-dicarboxylate transport system substrate-binding protein
MRLEEPTESSRGTIPPQQVWETLDPTQQKMVLQAVVCLCQQIIEMWKQEENDEQHSA